MIDPNKQVVIDFCTEFIKDNGYVRVGWACGQVRKDWINGHAKTDKEAIYNSLSALIISDNKFVRHSIVYYNNENDFEITKNPVYDLSENVKSTGNSLRELINITIPKQISSQKLVTGTNLTLATVTLFFVAVSSIGDCNKKESGLQLQQIILTQQATQNKSFVWCQDSTISEKDSSFHK